MLESARLDAVLAAADAGCFATYIMKQGGVLVPRKHHLIRTAYEFNDEHGTYGDHGIRIYGIWSPIVEGRICTHAMKWKMVRKAVDVQEATADQGARAPWTRGNNCPPVEKAYQRGGELPGSEEPAALPNFENMSKKELRELPEVLTPAKRKWICFCVAAACHLELVCACSIATSVCRRMTNGVSGTEKIRNEVIF